jgi:hypothetical protein
MNDQIAAFFDQSISRALLAAAQSICASVLIGSLPDKIGDDEWRADCIRESRLIVMDAMSTADAGNLGR